MRERREEGVAHQTILLQACCLTHTANTGFSRGNLMQIRVPTEWLQKEKPESKCWLCVNTILCAYKEGTLVERVYRGTYAQV